MWVPAIVCSQCRGQALPVDDAWTCAGCGARVTRDDGIARFLSDDQRGSLESFRAQYELVRDADGHRVDSAEDYGRLPFVATTHAAADEWRIRQESFATMCAQSLANVEQRRVLDVGAGNGWLSNRLARLGHEPVAVDISDHPGDGLQCARRYAAPFLLVQADFDALPFAPAQFDVVVLNASLHYARDPERTLLAMHRLLVPGGTLVVMDSPMFAEASDGELMVIEQFARLRSAYGLAAPIRRGVGYLTFDALRRAAERLRRRARYFPSHGSPWWFIRRAWARARIGRAPAAFGVWVAQ